MKVSLFGVIHTIKNIVHININMYFNMHQLYTLKIPYNTILLFRALVM